MADVFISSVIRGFEEYRKAARNTITSMGEKPIGCEDFGARSYSPEKACIMEVENADVYLLIMGEKYGFETSEGISVTQAEFQAAVKAGRSILAFVQNCEMEPKQKEFKKKVEDYKDGFVRETFTDVPDLKDQITKALRRLNESRRAASDSVFFERVEKATNELLGNSRSSRNHPMFVVAFWPHPMRPMDLVEVEEELAEKFTIMGRNQLLALKAGYDELHGKTYTGLKSGDNTLVFFEDGASRHVVHGKMGKCDRFGTSVSFSICLGTPFLHTAPLKRRCSEKGFPPATSRKCWTRPQYAIRIRSLK